MGVVAWSLGLFGASVFVHAIYGATGLSVGLVSSAVTAAYLLGAIVQLWVGSAVVRFGPGTVIPLAALAMGAGVVGLGAAATPVQVYAAFLVWGIGWACLSTTTITTTLAPWFERHQGRAVSTALLGASAGGMVGTPALLFGIRVAGFPATTIAAALVLLTVVLPVALLVLRRRPEDMGLLPDGATTRSDAATVVVRRWTRAEAIRTPELWTVMVPFGIGLLVQIGFLTHHVSLLVPALGAAGASATVTLTAATAFLGRILLARFSDRLPVRTMACAMLLLAAALLTSVASWPTRAVLVAASALYGITVAHVTTLFPIIVRREFGAASFGVVFGLAATGVQLMSALGPGFYGVLHDRYGGYAAPLLIAAALDVVAAALVLSKTPGASAHHAHESRGIG